MLSSGKVSLREKRVFCGTYVARQSPGTRTQFLFGNSVSFDVSLFLELGLRHTGG